VWFIIVWGLTVNMVLNVTKIKQNWRRMKSYIFWDITPYSSLKVNWCFGGICRVHLQGQRISQARNQHEAGSKQSQEVPRFKFRCWKNILTEGCCSFLLSFNVNSRIVHSNLSWPKSSKSLSAYHSWQYLHLVWWLHALYSWKIIVA
jgi:hypothetical protein